MADEWQRAEVEWEDACNLGTKWMTKDEVLALADSPLVIKSVGYIVTENKKRLVLAGDVSPHGLNSVSIIPKPWIRRRRLV